MKKRGGSLITVAAAALVLVLLAVAACQTGQDVQSEPVISPQPTSAEPLEETPPESLGETPAVASPTPIGLTEEELRSTTPQAPQELQATVSREGTRLEWKPAPHDEHEHGYSDTIAYYHVYRRTEGDMELTLLDQVVGTSYLDRTAEPATTYHYAVSAVHEGPTEGERTDEVTPTGELTFEEYRSTTPPSPVELRVELSEAGAHLAWKPAPPVQTEHSYGDTILRYNVYRGVQGEGELTFLASVTESQYLDTTAVAGVVYCYAVSAVYEQAVEGERSDAACLSGGLTFEEMRETNPPPPQNLHTACGDGQVRLEWKTAPASEMTHGYSQEILGYNIYRRTEGSYDLLLLTTVQGTSYVDDSVKDGVAYYYAVSAVHQGPIEGQRTDEVVADCP